MRNALCCVIMHMPGIGETCDDSAIHFKRLIHKELMWGGRVCADSGCRFVFVIAVRAIK